ncbi:hypothetical protein ATCC90586_012091 [Pythium insidiosum]|nr:hypothetical protein ATCC90586_012091 [Pythium insidiosum]
MGKAGGSLRAAVTSRRGSFSSLGGQGRQPLFKHEDALRQWIKDLRRDDFPVKSSHVVQFLIEEYSAWATAYLAGLLSLEELLQEQIQFTATIAASVSRTYPQGSIYNADETAVYFDDSLGLIIAEEGTGKSSIMVTRKFW